MRETYEIRDLYRILNGRASEVVFNLEKEIKNRELLLPLVGGHGGGAEGSVPTKPSSVQISPTATRCGAFLFFPLPRNGCARLRGRDRDMGR